LTPLVTLSVSAAITSSFAHNIRERHEWLGVVLSIINLNVSFDVHQLSVTMLTTYQDPEIAQVAPKIMDVLFQRMQGAYMQIAEVNVNDASLREISALSKRINEIKVLAG
jgi:hypothetical protein